MAKLNCWEFKQCGRQPGGTQAEELGVCPAAAATWLDSVNGGTKGGRACWAIVGTLCGGEVQGLFASKIATCIECEFFMLVAREEWPDYVGTAEILKMHAH